MALVFFFSSRRRHTRSLRDWSSDVCSSDLMTAATLNVGGGVLNFNTASPVSSLNLSAGTLGGTSPIAVSGLLTLNGGTVSNSLLKANGGLFITGNTTLSGTRLVNPGTALWTAGNFTGANGAVVS